MKSLGGSKMDQSSSLVMFTNLVEVDLLVPILAWQETAWGRLQVQLFLLWRILEKNFQILNLSSGSLCLCKMLLLRQETDTDFLCKVKLQSIINIIVCTVCHLSNISVTYSPCLELSWQHNKTILGSSERVAFSKEDGGFYHCDISQATLDDEVRNIKLPKSISFQSDCLQKLNVV